MAEPADDLEGYLRSYATRKAEDDAQTVTVALSGLKLRAVDAGDESSAKHYWCLEETLKAQQLYIQAFDELKRREFYQGWCTLERAEIVLHYLRRHFAHRFEEFGLNYVDQHVERWQAVFPYKHFISPEFVEHEKECTICDAQISIRKHCGHEPGEVYGGELALRRVTNMEFVGMAMMVKKPVQKYSVLFLCDPESGKRVDHHNYAVIEFIAQRLADPFHAWDYKLTSRRWPHGRFLDVLEHEDCPCESGAPYRDCCRQESGVLQPHFEIEFTVPPPKGLAMSALSEPKRPMRRKR